MGKSHTKEWKETRSKLFSGVNNPMYGKPGTNLGKKFSEEHKTKIGLANKGKIRSKEIRNQMSLRYIGKTYEERFGVEKALEIKQRRNDKLKGRKILWADKISKANKGKKLSQDTKDKLSRLYMGKTYEEIYGEEKSKEKKEKMRLSMLGKKHSEETKKKISESQKGPNNHMWEKHPSHETIKKKSETMKRLFREGKLTPPFKNKKLTGEHKHHISIGLMGRQISPETRLRLSIANKGRKPSMEQKRKMKEKATGRKYPEFDYPNHGMRGKKVSETTKLRMSEAHSLEKHHNWQGGKSFEPYSIDFNDRFKEMIRDRDNRCCVMCNIPHEKVDYRLTVHHIDYNKLNSFPQNCISLCRSCHTKTGINREHWKIFFQSILKERYGYEYTEDQKIILDFIKDKNGI